MKKKFSSLAFELSALISVTKVILKSDACVQNRFKEIDTDHVYTSVYNYNSKKEKELGPYLQHIILFKTFK
jgi:hypothetical protein